MEPQTFSIRYRKECRYRWHYTTRRSV
jgi:hypothetical protein